MTIAPAAMLTSYQMSHEKARASCKSEGPAEGNRIQSPHGTHGAQVADLKGLCKAKFLDRVSLLPFQLPDIVRRLHY